MSNLIRYQRPLTSIFNEFERSMDRILSAYPVLAGNFADKGNCWLPNIDIKDEDKSYIVEADMPGMNKDDIKISIDQNNNLIIEGEKESETKKEFKDYLYSERCRGSFFRKIYLPDAVDSQNIKAKYQNGVLEVNIPKTEVSSLKKISIED